MAGHSFAAKATDLPSHDAHSLRQAGRSTAPPFKLSLMDRSISSTLICQAILRNLPGKRLVCFGKWEDHEAVVAKIYLDRHRAQKHLQRELEGINALETNCIPTPALLCKGTLADGRTPLLLTRRIENARDLEKILLENPPDPEIKRMLSTVITVIAQMHSAGLSQYDTHLGNFLIVQDAVMIIDGADIRSHNRGPLPERKSIANLGLFLAQFYPEFERFIPFLIAVYCSCRPWPLSPGLQSRVAATVTRWSDWREKQFLKKTVRPCTAFVAQRSWHRRMACDRNWYSQTMQHLLDDPDAAMDAGTVLKAGNTATVVKIDFEGHPLVIKRYNLKNSCHTIRRALRPTRAIVSWRNGNRLRFMGIMTPRPVAFLEKRWGPLRGRAYFITTYVAGESIQSVIQQNADDPDALKAWVNLLLSPLEKLRQLRISHGDLKASNFLVANQQLHILDLDGMQKHRSINGFRRAFRRDIKRLQENWLPDTAFSAFLTIRLKEVFKDA